MCLFTLPKGFVVCATNLWCYNMSVVLQQTLCGATTNTLWCCNKHSVVLQHVCGATTNTPHNFCNVTCAPTLKVEAAAWLEDGSCVCDQCPGEDEHVQNEVHAL